MSRNQQKTARRGSLALAAGVTAGVAATAASVHSSAWSCPRSANTVTSDNSLRGLTGLTDGRAPRLLKTTSAATALATRETKKPKLDYPPQPAASATWPRWIPFLAGAAGTIQIFRRKLLGGAEAVALDPALPPKVRLELIKSRKDLRSKGSSAPRSFRTMLSDSADTLEEIPALLVTVAVLAGAALQGRKGAQGGIVDGEKTLLPFRRLGEAQVLLFTAGVLHYGMKDGSKGTMRLLGGDFLFAEGQWMLAELGSLPVIRLTAKMIRDVSDGCSKGGPAAGEDGSIERVGPEFAFRAAFLRAGTYFATVAGGAAWMTGSNPKAVAAFRRYGTDLGCALQLAKYRTDPLSQDAAIWFARSAMEALEELDRVLPGKGILAMASIRGLKRLAFRVERSCEATLKREIASGRIVRGMSIAEFTALRQKALDEMYANSIPMEGIDKSEQGEGLGFQRNDASDKELFDLIAVGLAKGPEGEKPLKTLPPIQWPEQGPKAALEAGLRCIGKELMVVNKQLDGSGLAEPAKSILVQEQVLRLFATGGKRLRPALTLLVARALQADDTAMRNAAALASSVEVLHSASLVHDDMLDESDLRRGEATAHKLIGEKAATLVGDFLFATASCLVAELGSMPVVVLISKVVADFGRGELAQSAVRFEAVDYSLEDYLAKSFYKTASLLAAACHASAVLSGAGPASKEAKAMYRFGAFVGLAFQVVDDVLDFTSSEEELGKPALADLKEGNLSAPILFAAQQSGLMGPSGKGLGDEDRDELLQLLDRRLASKGDLDRVIKLVEDGEGVQRANVLSRRFVDLAVAELDVLPENEAKDALRTFAEFVVVRTN